MTCVVALFLRGNPDLKEVVIMLGLGLVVMIGMGLWVPAGAANMGGVCRISRKAIERPTAQRLRCYGVGFDYLTWDWRQIAALELTAEELEGKSYRLLWVIDAEGKRLGCVGLSERVEVSQLQEWATRQKCPLRIDPSLVP